jgi:hypothetical protein
METIKDKVLAWAQRGGDLREGISLFLTFNRNAYYALNIERKGVERGLATLVSEFANKTKIPAKEIWNVITGARETKSSISEPVVIIQPRPVVIDVRRREQEIGRLKLREEFPFLARKDCPDELAVLVNKMLTAYDDYTLNRKNLFEVDTNDQEKCYVTAREVVDAYILNRECWNELDYYKIHGKILGKMPQFKLHKLREKYNAMGAMELSNIMNNNIRRRVSYYKKQLANDKAKNKEEMRDHLLEAETETKLIKDILRERGLL